MQTEPIIPDDTSALIAFRCGILHAVGGFDTGDLTGRSGPG